MNGHLVLWSGGVESTSLLLYLLTNTSDRIVAHHVDMTNPEGDRWLMEHLAMSRLRTRLTKIRPFEESKSTISICDGQAWPRDYDVLYPIGMAAMYHHRCDKIHWSWCLEDSYRREPPYQSKGVPKELYRSKAQLVEAMIRLKDVTAEECAPWFDFYGYPKAWHVKHLGSLFHHTWSCRKPIEGIPCLTCHSCKERLAAEQCTSNIPAIAKQMEDGEL